MSEPVYGGGEIRGFINFKGVTEMTDEEKQKAGRETAFRFPMFHALKMIEGLCGTVPQTTHAAFPLARTIEEVMEKFAKAWKDPTPYNVSELAQHLRAFLNTQPWSE